MEAKLLSKVLIIYGTRYGASASTSEEIAKVLRGENFEVQVEDAKRHKLHDLSEYDHVIVGSGMQVEMWTGAAKGFLKKFHAELANKKMAIFVSSGAQALFKHQGKLDQIERTRKKYLENKALKFNLRPLAFGMFGGVWDFNRLPWWSRKAMAMTRQELEAAGFKETKLGIYDTRDWDAIRGWAIEVARKVASPV